MAAVTKTVLLSLVSRTSFQNSTAPLPSSSIAPSASGTETLSQSTSFNPTISVNASNAGAVCNAQSIAWSSSSESWRDASMYHVTFTTTEEYDTSTFVTGLYTCTSSCGSSPGAISYCGPSTPIYNTTHISTAHVTSTYTWPAFPSPAPNCTIPDNDCLAISTSYSSSLESYFSVPYESRSGVHSPESPQCCVKTACTFDYGAVDFYFFPMTMTKNLTRDMCTDGPEGGWENSVTTTPNPDSSYTEVTTGAYTVINGNTMYEGNVYLSLSDPWVRDNCYNTVEPQVVKPRIITMASSDVFSVRGYPHNIIPYSVNYADFIEPVPWSAYLGGRYCYNNRVACTQVFPGEYYPIIRMPGQIRHLDPNWASCEFTEFPLFDPPIALTAVPNFLTSSSAVADPTPTSAEPIVTATPGQSSNDDSPPATSTPKPTSRPDDPEDPVSSPTLQNPPPSQTQAPNDPEPGETQTPNDPQEPVPSNGQNTPSPQDPTPSSPQAPSQIEGPSPSDPQIPNPANPTPGDPQEPGPGNPITSGPNDPSDPGASASATPSPNDPQNSTSPGNSANPIPSGGVTAGPGSNPTAGPGSNPTAGPGNNPSEPGNNLTEPGNNPAEPGNNPTVGPGNNPTAVPEDNPTGTPNNGQSSPAAPSITVGPTVIPVDPTGGIIINPGTTLTNGGAPVVISSTTFSIGTGGLTIVSPETSTKVQFGDGPITVPVGPSDIPVVLDPNESTIVIGGTTLTQGGDPVTIEDNTLSVGSSGVVVVGPSGTTTIDIPIVTTTGTGTGTSVGAGESPSTPSEFTGAAVPITESQGLLAGMICFWLVAM